jgi:alpha-D-ribose 1-methylphosphonate 5-triphosphate synthase subunit PhnH
MITLQKGLDSEVFDSQAVFRQLLSAITCPGTITATDIKLSCPDRLHMSAGALLLTLLDFETPFWADLAPDSPEINWLKFHTGAPVTHNTSRAGFALLTDYKNLLDPDQFNPGTMISPDISTTLIIQTRGMDQGRHLRLTGPGIKKETFLHLTGISKDFLERRAVVNQAYPAGIDMIFVHADQFTALPRTTKTEIC